MSFRGSFNFEFSCGVPYIRGSTMAYYPQIRNAFQLLPTNLCKIPVTHLFGGLQLLRANSLGVPVNTYAFIRIPVTKNTTSFIRNSSNPKFILDSSKCYHLHIIVGVLVADKKFMGTPVIVTTHKVNWNYS